MEGIEKIRKIFSLSREMTDEELEFIKSQPKEDTAEIILEHLEYPNQNVLVAAYHLPDKRYEDALLSYKPKEMYCNQPIYWMLTLGKIRSENAFEKILHFTETNLFHQAYIALSEIDPPRAFEHFEKYLDTHCRELERHESGLSTLVVMIKNNGTKELKKYDLSDPAKKKLVDKAIDESITW